MAELVGISEGYEYEHKATKNQKSNTHKPLKFKIRDPPKGDKYFIHLIKQIKVE